MKVSITKLQICDRLMTTDVAFVLNLTTYMHETLQMQLPYTVPYSVPINVFQSKMVTSISFKHQPWKGLLIWVNLPYKVFILQFDWW